MLSYAAVSLLAPSSFSSSMWVLRPVTGMGGWLSIPGVCKKHKVKDFIQDSLEQYLKVHPSQLHGVRGGDDGGIGHVKAGHEGGGHLAPVHGLLQRLPPPPEHDHEDNQEGESYTSHHRAHHPAQTGAPALTGDQVTVDTWVLLLKFRMKLNEGF